MTSNSPRMVQAARAEAAVQPRSTAQQIEHRAKLAGEAAGDSDLWAFKRQRQREDMAAAARGDVTQDQLSWFSGGKARKLRLIDSPY